MNLSARALSTVSAAAARPVNASFGAEFTIVLVAAVVCCVAAVAWLGGLGVALSWASRSRTGRRHRLVLRTLQGLGVFGVAVWLVDAGGAVKLPKIADQAPVLMLASTCLWFVWNLAARQLATQGGRPDAEMGDGPTAAGPGPERASHR
jgi:hypothetical protein